MSSGRGGRAVRSKAAQGQSLQRAYGGLLAATGRGIG
jgi:hypothetical protein